MPQNAMPDAHSVTVHAPASSIAPPNPAARPLSGAPHSAIQPLPLSDALSILNASSGTRIVMKGKPTAASRTPKWGKRPRKDDFSDYSDDNDEEYIEDGHLPGASKRKRKATTKSATKNAKRPKVVVTSTATAPQTAILSTTIPTLAETLGLGPQVSIVSKPENSYATFVPITPWDPTLPLDIAALPLANPQTGYPTSAEPSLIPDLKPAGWPYWGAEHCHTPPPFVSSPIERPEVGLHTLASPMPGARPNYNYVTIIRCAILGCPMRRLTLDQIYEQVSGRFPYFKKEDKSWQNSIRHTLSLSACFVKVQRTMMEPGKGWWWTVNEEVTGGNKRPRKRSSRSKQAMHERAMALNTGVAPAATVLSKPNNPTSRKSKKSKASSTEAVAPPVVDKTPALKSTEETPPLSAPPVLFSELPMDSFIFGEKQPKPVEQSVPQSLFGPPATHFRPPIAGDFNAFLSPQAAPAFSMSSAFSSPAAFTQPRSGGFAMFGAPISTASKRPGVGLDSDDEEDLSLGTSRAEFSWRAVGQDDD